MQLLGGVSMKFKITYSMVMILVAGGMCLPACAQNWPDTSKINKWFDGQKDKKYEIQSPTGPIQTPGQIQTPGNIQNPRISVG